MDDNRVLITTVKDMHLGIGGAAPGHALRFVLPTRTGGRVAAGSTQQPAAVAQGHQASSQGERRPPADTSCSSPAAMHQPRGIVWPRSLCISVIRQHMWHATAMHAMAAHSILSGEVRMRIANRQQGCAARVAAHPILWDDSLSGISSPKFPWF